MKMYSIRMEKEKKKPTLFLMMNSYESVALFHSCILQDTVYFP